MQQGSWAWTSAYALSVLKRMEKGLRVRTMPVLQGPYRAAGQALEVIPRTLAQNCGTNVIRALTKLRARHSEEGGSTFGIDGNKGVEPQHRCCESLVVVVL